MHYNGLHSFKNFPRICIVLDLDREDGNSTISSQKILCKTFSSIMTQVEWTINLYWICPSATLPTLSSSCQVDHSVITGWEHVPSVLETVT